MTWQARRTQYSHVPITPLLMVVAIAVVLLVSGCDSEYAETPFEGAYLGTYVVSGTVTQADRNELIVTDGSVYAVLTDDPPPPGVGTPYVPGVGDEIDQIAMVKFPNAPWWSRDDGGVYVEGRRYAIFVSTTVTAQGEHETVAWFGFDIDSDLPVAPFRNRKSYAGVPAVDVLACLSDVHSTSGSDARLDALVADAQREWRGEPRTNCYDG